MVITISSEVLKSIKNRRFKPNSISKTRFGIGFKQKSQSKIKDLSRIALEKLVRKFGVRKSSDLKKIKDFLEIDL